LPGFFIKERQNDQYAIEGKYSISSDPGKKSLGLVKKAEPQAGCFGLSEAKPGLLSTSNFQWNDFEERFKVEFFTVLRTF